MSSRLRKIELQGYKTFASHTIMEYPASITAVVGPNGAGKSNVADAVRWVLGEQAYSLLRGRKTEDMIFSGSEQRARASMASVTITFDNADGWLPIDFSEVAITRRAYRDGQNEYLLNGQRVRLKEISELLAQSGLAERTYTIIGQGLVDTALSLKPEERRRFFEEAAGIELYRARREESLNRLEQTQRNLERVIDIMGELEPRLHSLEKQANRYQEYERIKSDLQILLRDWYGYHWHIGQQQVVHTREQVRQHESRLEQSRQILNSIEEQLEQTRSRLRLLRGNLNEWHAESASLHNQRELISRKLAVLDERKLSMLSQDQSLAAEKSRMEEERHGLALRIQLKRDQNQELGASLAEARDHLENTKNIYQGKQREKEEAENELKTLRTSLVAVQTRKIQETARVDESNQRLNQQQSTIGSLSQAIEKGKTSILALEDALETAKRTRDREEKNLGSQELTLNKVRKKLEALEQDRQKLIDERNSVEADLSRMQAQIDILDQAERSFSGLNQGARFILENVTKGVLKGKFEPLGSSLIVPKELERAIASVLGDLLDGIVVDTGTDLDPVLDMLEKGENGRAALLLAQPSINRETFALPLDPDVIGKASDLVRPSGGDTGLVEQVLGKIGVVRDRKTARRLIESLPAGTGLVTLKGEVFWRSGLILAGQDGRTVLVSRPRQKRELVQNIANLGEKKSRLEKNLEKIDIEIDFHRKTGDEQLKSVEKARRNLDASREAFQKATLDLEQARQQSNWQKQQLDELTSSKQDSEVFIQHVKAEIGQLSLEEARLVKLVQQQTSVVASMLLDEHQSQVTHWTSQVAVVERAMSDLEQHLNEDLADLELHLIKEQEIETRLKTLYEALNLLDQERNNSKDQEAEITSRLDVLESQIKPAERELEDLDKNYLDHQEKQIEAQQGVTLVERFLAQSQVEMAREKESLDSLRRRIEEDFGLVSFEGGGDLPEQTPLPFAEMVSKLPRLEELPADLDENINHQRSLIRRLGAVNPEAMSEFRIVQERFGFLATQIEDLQKADADLRKVISELDELMKLKFRTTFDAVATEFRQMFTRLFGGGSAKLVLIDEDNPAETGVDIETRLPGKREQGLFLLSGGERSLTAVALIFALLKVSPTPFCVLDEVDAMLDEANVGRFCELLEELSRNTQFIVITHNRNTVQTADVIYGVTMGRDSASQIISLRLDEVSEEMIR